MKCQICTTLEEKSDFPAEKFILKIFAVDFRIFALDGSIGQKYVSCRQSWNVILKT